MKLTLRDLFWLTVVVGLAVGWLLDHRAEEWPTTQVTGVVRAVTKTDLIEVSLGSDDGLKAGHVIQIFRGKTYLGQATIRKTSPDLAVGQLSWPCGKIQKGDRVTTKDVVLSGHQL